MLHSLENDRLHERGANPVDQISQTPILDTEPKLDVLRSAVFGPTLIIPRSRLFFSHAFTGHSGISHPECGSTNAQPPYCILGSTYTVPYTSFLKRQIRPIMLV